jgi:truncated hemoglobin YjbI
MTFLDDMKRFVGFEDIHERALAHLLPLARPEFGRIVEAFYDRILRHDEARAVLHGPAQVERLKQTLHRWLESLLAGPWDERYFEERSRIGRVHVRVALPQRYMFAAMDVIRLALCEVADAAFSREVTCHAEVVAALHKILDIELAIMLESYVGDCTSRAERLASLAR